MNGKYKLPMILDLAIEENIGIIAITESHLNEYYLESEVHILGYSHYRADRKAGTRKGGIIVYVRNDLSPGLKILAFGSVGKIEYIVLHLETLKLIYVVIYRPPASEKEHFEAVMKDIACELDINDANMSNIVFTGDLNLPIINWNTHTISGGSASDRSQATSLLNFFQD